MTSDCIMRLRAKIGKQLLLLPSVAAVIHDSSGALLLQENASGEGWSLPAGGIEPGETPQQAITREVAEETGLTLTAVELLDVYGGRDFRYTYPTATRWNTPSAFSNAPSPEMPARRRMPKPGP